MYRERGKLELRGAWSALHRELAEEDNVPLKQTHKPEIIIPPFIEHFLGDGHSMTVAFSNMGFPPRGPAFTVCLRW